VTERQETIPERLQRLAAIDAALAPFADQLERFDLGVPQAIAALFASQDFMDRQPINGLIFMARSYGVDFVALRAALDQQMTGFR
jgi:hypothetical protein